MPRLHSRSTLARIDTKITALGGSSICTVGNLPNPTHEARTTKYLKVANAAGVDRLPVVIVGGVHARELAQPPALLNFLDDLITAYNPGGAARRPITVARFDDPRTATSYPEFTIPAPVVQRIVERLDLYVVPVVNPDGRDYVLSARAHALWRKNRKPSPAGTVCMPVSDRFGADINRNFNFAWDVDVYYSVAAAASAAISRDPCDLQEYNGERPPASEAETLNVQWLVDEKKPKFFVDCHSHSRLILTPWATDNNQSIDSTKNFRNANWDRGGSSGERDGVTVATYGEYFPNGSPERLLDAHNALGNSIRDKIRTHARETYAPPQQAAKLYEPLGVSGVTGTSIDYAFSRPFIAGSGFTSSVYAIAMEFGHIDDDGFHPHPTRVYPKIEREIYAALWAILDYAATWTAPVASGGCSGCGDCFIATAAFDSDLHPDVLYLKRLRDDLLAPTILGKKFIRAVLFVYNNISPPVARFIRKKSGLRAFVRNACVKPVIWQIRKADKLSRIARTSEKRVSFFIQLLLFLLFVNISALIAIGFVMGKYFFGI